MGLKDRWFRRPPSDDEMREELEAHVAMRAEHDGVEATAARRRLGNALQAREAMRRVWIAGWWDALRQDAHFTWRSWWRQPGFALGAVFVLALGLGASMALFAALDRVLFRPLRYPDPDRLVSVGRTTVPLAFPGQTEIVLDRFYLQEWTTPPAPFQSVTAMMALVGTRTCEIAEGQQEGLRCDQVVHNFLRVLGVRVALGRDFVPEDDVRGAPPVAIISHGLWVRRFGSDPEAINRTLRIERASSLLEARVIGVLPPGFEMPFETADILLPAQLGPIDPKSPFVMSMTVLARLRPDVTPERAAQMLDTQWPKGELPALPGMREEWRVRTVWHRRVGDAGRAAWLLVGAVAAFLLIACVNVTNLMLVRVGERQREFGVRAAIGAGRMRLARLALAESLLLSLAAGGFGLFVAFALLQTFVAMAPPGIPGIANASLDLRVFAVAAALVAVTGTIIGLWPAVSVFRAGDLHGLRTTATPSMSARPRLRFALVTTQIALTLALLGGSALLLRSLWNVVSIPLGFNAERVITMNPGLGRVRYPTVEQGAAFLEELLARARAMPGVVSAALSDTAPPPSSGASFVGWEVEGLPADPQAPLSRLRNRSVTPQYFETFQIPVVRGRTFQDGDWAGEPAVALNESAERMLFRGASAVGRRIRIPIRALGQPVQRPWYRVVGVIADVRNGPAVTDEPSPELYFPARPGRWSGPSAALASLSAPAGHLSVRTTAAPADVAAFLRQIVADIDPQQLVTIQTGDEQLTRLTAQPRFIAWLLTAFAVLALLLAGAGLYSVAAYLVTQRRRDMAVRVALGAAPHDVAGHVVGEAGRWIVAGALLGCALGWMGTRVLQSQLYGVEALDPWSWAGALFALAAVMTMAVFRPAHRAAHVDPVAALQGD